MTQPSVALTLPNMNNEPVLDLFFARLRKNTTYSNIEVVVVDDGSTDASVPILRRWRDSGAFPRFTLIEQENRGVIHAFNRALSAVESEIVVRLDGDATVETPGWLERMLAFYLTDERIGVVVAQIVYESGLVHSLGRNLVCKEGLHDRGSLPAEPAGRRTLDSNVHRYAVDECPVPLEIAEVDSALGCCTMFSTSLADDIGGLDPRFSPVWIEDDDFGLSARALGKKVFFFPEVKVVHRPDRRNPRGAPSHREPSSLQRRVGRMLPRRVRSALRPAMGFGDAPWRVELLQRHYATWREKWGFDPLNPQMTEIANQYGTSEVWWAFQESRRRAGEDIIAAYSRLSPDSSTHLSV